MIEKIRNKLASDANLKELLTGSAITFVLKMTGMGLGYLLIYIISQRLGAEGVGFYNLMLQILTVLGMFLGLGMNISVLRYVGQFDNEGERHKMHDLYRYFVSTVGPLSVIVSVGLYVTADWFTIVIGKEPEYAMGLRLVAIILPFFTVNQISVEFIRGLKKLQISELVRSVLMPLIVILGILLVFNSNLSKMDVAYLLLIALVVNSFVSRLAIWDVLRDIEKKNNDFSLKELLRTSSPMMITGISGSLIMATPIFFIDYMLSEEMAGIYSVASQLSKAVTIILLVVNAIAAPKFANLFWLGKKAELQTLIDQASKILFWIALLSSVLMIVFRVELLGLFGTTYTDHGIVLVVLILGQFVNTATGSVGLMLNMSGNQRILSLSLSITAVVMAVLMYFAILKFSILGASIVVALGQLALYSFLAFITYKKLGLKTFYTPRFTAYEHSS